MLAKASLHQDRRVRIEIGAAYEDLCPSDARILSLELMAHADKADALNRADERERKRKGTAT